MVYAPTNQATEEVKDQFCTDLDRVMTKINGLTVLGYFNASFGDSVPGVVAPHGQSKRTSEIGERLVEFASTPDVCYEHTAPLYDNTPSNMV